ncbi:CidA/LrgA family protein [Paenibacillus sp. GCM10023252]|uniref:CidA/LrgA family protein n=1 Tax=Paenibacillus sp. GCM10023252 TaxID=3252649 RepID=UPI00361EF96F
MLGFAIILMFNLLGLLLHEGLHIPLPSNVLGLMLLAAALFLKWIKLAWVEEAASRLTSHMMLYFAPVIVGVIVFTDQLQMEWLFILASQIGGAVVVLLVTGWIVQKLVREEVQEDERNEPSIR